MITTVNEAINRKLASISFTDIIIGTVQSLEPLEIRINNRIVIGLSFIEPMSLGLDDNSPSSALPLTVGEKIQMIRYSNGQRFYILGKSASASTINYNELQNKPKLNTANSTSLSVNESEELKGIISLHKVAKTGSYNDLLNKPAPVDLSNYVTLDGAQTISGKKTFSTLPESSKTPTTANQLINKNYVDTNFLQFEVIEEF
jgi:hypothetical protein